MTIRAPMSRRAFTQGAALALAAPALAQTRKVNVAMNQNAADLP